MNLVRKKIISIARLLYACLSRDYLQINKGTQYKIFVSYLSEPFWKKDDLSYMNKHQNRRETLIMADVLKSLKLSCRFTRLDKPHYLLPNYDIVFGVEPNFIRACKNNPRAVKIYYATGAYYKHQNKVIQQRTDSFNKQNKTNIPYIRLVKEHNACEIADYIIQIGSKFTLESYPKDIRKKIITIRQSCHNFQFKNFISQKLELYSRNDFIWMGSAGSILKGFDIVVDYFLTHPEYRIHIVGHIDEEVWNYYKQKICNATNILVYGFVDLDSEQMQNIARMATFVIMPSASEGCPGSVINLMKLGCIPIVTPYSAFDEIESYGVLINGYTSEYLGEAIKKVALLSDNEIKTKIMSTYKFANENFNAHVFQEDFRNCMKYILSRNEN